MISSRTQEDNFYLFLWPSICLSGVQLLDTWKKLKLASNLWDQTDWPFGLRPRLCSLTFWLGARKADIWLGKSGYSLQGNDLKKKVGGLLSITVLSSFCFTQRAHHWLWAQPSNEIKIRILPAFLTSTLAQQQRHIDFKIKSEKMNQYSNNFFSRFWILFQIL